MKPPKIPLALFWAFRRCLLAVELEYIYMYFELLLQHTLPEEFWVLQIRWNSVTYFTLCDYLIIKLSFPFHILRSLLMSFVKSKRFSLGGSGAKAEQNQFKSQVQKLQSSTKHSKRVWDYVKKFYRRIHTCLAFTLGLWYLYPQRISFSVRKWMARAVHAGINSAVLRD